MSIRRFRGLLGILCFWFQPLPGPSGPLRLLTPHCRIERGVRSIFGRRSSRSSSRFKNASAFLGLTGSCLEPNSISNSSFTDNSFLCRLRKCRSRSGENKTHLHSGQVTIRLSSCFPIPISMSMSSDSMGSRVRRADSHVGGQSYAARFFRQAFRHRRPIVQGNRRCYPIRNRSCRRSLPEHSFDCFEPARSPNITRLTP